MRSGRWPVAAALLLSTPAAADMYQDGSNAKLPQARGNLHAYPGVDPRDYGAVCDGTARPLSSVYSTLAAAQATYPVATSLAQELDWAAVQTALNTAPGSVRVKGICVIGEALLVSGNTDIAGHSKPDGFKANAAYSSSVNLINIAPGATDVHVRDLKLDGSNLAASGIVASGAAAKRISIDNNWVTSFLQTGIQLGEGSDFRITRNTVENTALHGIVTTLAAQDVNIASNTILNPGGACIAVSSINRGSVVGNFGAGCGPLGDGIMGYKGDNQDVTVANNVILNSENHGIHLGGTGMNVVGNIIINPANDGVRIQSELPGSEVNTEGFDCVVGNNTSASAGGAGIRLTQMSGCSVTGNVSVNSGGSGMSLIEVSNSTVTGNNIRNTTGHGLFIAGSSYNVISGNRTEGSTGTGYQINVSGAVASTNDLLVGNLSKGDANGFVEGGGATVNYNIFAANRVIDPVDLSYQRSGGAGLNSVYDNIPLYGEVVYDPPSLADGAGATTTMTVTGAAAGDRVEGSFSEPLNGVVVTYFVSSGSTVAVRFQNGSGSVQDIVSGTLRAWVKKR